MYKIISSILNLLSLFLGKHSGFAESSHFFFKSMFLWSLAIPQCILTTDFTFLFNLSWWQLIEIFTLNKC